MVYLPRFASVLAGVAFLVSPGVLGCSSSDDVGGAPPDAGVTDAPSAAGGDSSQGAGGLRAGSGGATGSAGVGSSGMPSVNGGSTSGGAAGNGGTNTGGAGGSMGTAGARPDAGAADATPENPACAAADGSGFFSDCTVCIDRSNCDTVDTSGSVRHYCGCSTDGDCPCGLACGCIDLAPQVQTCGVCKR